jgi:hypothetical protein
VTLPTHLQTLADRIAGAGDDVQREQLRSIVDDYDPDSEAATEAQLRLLLQSVDEGSPLTRRVATFRLRHVHVGTGAAIVVAAIVVVSRTVAPTWTSIVFLAVLLGVLLLAWRVRKGGISLRSGSTTFSLTAGARARPTGEVRPLANPPAELVARLRDAVARSGMTGAYLYATVVDGEPQPTLGLHFGGDGGASFVLSHAPVLGEQLRVEDLDDERLAQVRAVTEPIAGE